MLDRVREKLKYLDPFAYVDKYVSPVLNPKKDPLLSDAIDVFFALVFAYILYNFVLAFLLGTSTPIVIVFSGSMEPVLYRGDAVVLVRADDLTVNEAVVGFPVSGKRLAEFADVVREKTGQGYPRAAAIRIGKEKEYSLDPNGPVVVYHSNSIGQDIIHRAVLRLRAPDGSFLLTQGDNMRTNFSVDQDCTEAMIRGRECNSVYLVEENKLNGRYFFHIPFVGHVKLLLFDDIPKLLGLIKG